MVDLGFAISARAQYASRNYRKMTEIMKEFVTKYGLGRVRYTVITFGRQPDVKLRLDENTLSEEALKTYLEAIPRSNGGSDLAKALEKAKEVFIDDSHSDVKKILVVMMDKKSESRAEDVREAGQQLDINGITVIAIALHEEADSRELANVTSSYRNVIVANSTSTPTHLVEEIMRKGLKGRLKAFEVFCSFVG